MKHFSFHILTIAIHSNLFTYLLEAVPRAIFFLSSMEYHQYEQKRREKKIREEAVVNYMIIQEIYRNNKFNRKFNQT
jgi:hypothetical protein